MPESIPRDPRRSSQRSMHRQKGAIRSSAVLSSLVVVVVVTIGLAYVFLSGGRIVSGFDVANLPDHGRADAPVTVVLIQDFRCGSCQKFHDDVVDALMRDYVESGQVRLRFAVLPAVRKDSPDLAALALSYSIHRDVSFAEISAVLFEADSPRIDLTRAEAVLAEHFGTGDPARTPAMIAAARERVIDTGRYLISRDIDRVPSVVVGEALLFSPTRELVYAEIERALASGVIDERT